MVTSRKVGLVNRKALCLTTTTSYLPAGGEPCIFHTSCRSCDTITPPSVQGIHTHPMSTQEHNMLYHSACISGKLHSQLLHRWSTYPLILPHKQDTNQYPLHNWGVYAESGITQSTQYYTLPKQIDTPNLP